MERDGLAKVGRKTLRIADWLEKTIGEDARRVWIAERDRRRYATVQRGHEGSGLTVARLRTVRVLAEVAEYVPTAQYQALLHTVCDTNSRLEIRFLWNERIARIAIGACVHQSTGQTRLTRRAVCDIRRCLHSVRDRGVS